MYHSDSRFYLRSLPFVGAILVFFLTLYLFPNVVSTVIDYILHTDPEEYLLVKRLPELHQLPPVQVPTLPG